VTDAIHQLLLLQEQDTLTDQIRYRRAHHPLRGELAGLEAEGSQVAQRAEEIRAQLGEITQRLRTAEAEVEAAQGRMAAIEARMYSGEVTAARDLQAMAGEVEALKDRVGQGEEVALAAMEEAEPLEALLAEQEQRLSALASRSGELEAEIMAADAELAAEEAAHLGRRRQMAEDVPPSLLARYDRLRQHLGGVAAAPLVNGSCAGCHLSLPATELERLRRAPADEVITCEQCGRILVRP
jgi:predicted  nucleic acid-binding Zn-ribbon protein